LKNIEEIFQMFRRGVNNAYERGKLRSLFKKYRRDFLDV